MPLVKATLKANLETRIKGVDLANEDVPAKIAEILADEIDTYIKSATVTVAAGIPVSTAGTAAAQTGATTALGTATIN